MVPVNHNNFHDNVSVDNVSVTNTCNSIRRYQLMYSARDNAGVLIKFKTSNQTTKVAEYSAEYLLTLTTRKI